LIVLNFSFSAC